MTTYSVEYLHNGFILIRDRRSGLQGVFNRDGSIRSGGLDTADFNAAMADES